MNDEPTRSEGVWGYAGYDWSYVHKCINGKTICKNSQNQRRRSLRATRKNWDPEHAKTCPRCKELDAVGYNEDDMKEDDKKPSNPTLSTIPPKSPIS
jgi:hypothetical protein